MKAYTYLFLLAVAVLPSLFGCGGRTEALPEGESIRMSHSKLLALNRIDSNTVIVTLKNPWDTTLVLDKYALIKRGHKLSTVLPTDIRAINVPIERAIVYSGIHTSLINELGCLDKVKGVCDSEYISDPATCDALKSGRIANCGSNYSPILEKIITLNPEVIILSPYEQTSDLQRYKKAGLTVIQAADYMEGDPLARAEWIKLFAMLFGSEQKGDSLFSSIESDYIALKQSVSNSSYKPTVLYDRLYGGVWSVPTSGSVTGRIIEDAGGINPFSDYNKGGSAQLSGEEVLHKAQDADIWLIRYSEKEMTINKLSKENPVYSKFKAFKGKNIFGANTVETRLFDDGAFHPEKTLKEMIMLLHPEKRTEPFTYFHQIQ